MWLTPIPWARRTWALPVLTTLAPSERYCQQMGRTHKKITDWARQMIIQLRRWLPNRTVVVVADSSYAALDLLAFCQSMSSPVTFITRLRMDAALYEPAPPRLPGQIGRPRIKGQRLPTLKELADQPTTLRTGVTIPWYDGILRRVEIASHTAVWYHCGKAPVPIRWVLIRDPMGEFQPQALLCTDRNVEPTRIIEWFVLRWQLEVTPYPVRGRLFQEVRTHLWSRDSTPMVRSRHSPYHAGSVGTVLVDNRRGSSAAKATALQARADLRRRDRVGASSYVERL